MRVKFAVGDKVVSLELDTQQPSQRIIFDFLTAGYLYESSTVRALQEALRPGQTFLDVGAHVGYFSVVGAALVCESGQVHAFEPNPNNFEALSKIAAPCFHAHQVAVRSTQGTSCLYHNADNDGGHACWDVGRHPLNPKSRLKPQIADVETVALDSFEFSDIGAIKIDVEGSEFEVLIGAHDTLRDNPAAIVICEINRFGLRQLGHSERDIREFMQALGYQCFLLPQYSDDPVLLADDEIIQTDLVFNLMFRP